MFLPLTDAEIVSLRTYLDANEDCDALSTMEYVADLYAAASPISLNLVFEEGGVRIDGAAVLGFDEALDGYYMASTITEIEDVRRVLAEVGALPKGE